MSGWRLLRFLVLRVIGRWKFLLLLFFILLSLERADVFKHVNGLLLWLYMLGWMSS